MSYVLREYHFDSLKKFATTLKHSDWSDVDIEIAENYMRELHKKYQQVQTDTKTLGRDPVLLAEAELIYGMCRQIIEAHVAKMNRRVASPQYFGVVTDDEVELELPLPPQDVGHFDGSFIDWCDFLERFNAIVHSNNQLSNVEKLRRLLQAVTGDAARELSRWPILDSQYVPAINKLRAAYGNRYLIARSHIEAMEARPPIDSTYESIYQMIREIEKARKDFTKMQVSLDRWELMIIAAMEKRLDDRSKESWMGIRHSDQTGDPTLSDLMTFLRGRARALPSTSSRSHMFWSGPTSKMFQESSQRSPSPAPVPKVEAETPQNSQPGRKSLKNGECLVCCSAVHEDRIECRECPAVVHYRCLRNAGMVKTKKEANQWKCKNCLRCAGCRGTKKANKVSE